MLEPIDKVEENGKRKTQIYVFLETMCFFFSTRECPIIALDELHRRACNQRKLRLLCCCSVPCKRLKKAKKKKLPCVLLLLLQLHLGQFIRRIFNLFLRG